MNIFGTGEKMENSVKVTVNGKSVLVKKGTPLSDILDIEKPCGGNGKCGKCLVLVNGKEELACRYIISSDAVVQVGRSTEMSVETGVEESGNATENLCYVLDVGTTTLALALVSLDEKRTVKVLTATNPQRAFGADIMTRIDFCRKSSVKPLQRVLVEEINAMIAKMTAPTVDDMYVCANVTMLHTLFGVDCTSIGIAPYTPAFLERREATAESIGLDGVKRVVSLPSVSSFVGADIVAGLYYTGLPTDGKYNLLIDLGTNAEIVLYSSKSGLSTAAAAGPCFEGANISCGMSATEGAIYAFESSYGRTAYKTVNGVEATGICGTGLVDIISELLKNGVIDETGYIDGNYKISDRVYLSPNDVRQYQLAKSAIYSAILALMRNAGVDFCDVSTLYISGGFSSKINITSAVTTGLIPRELAPKTVALNNSALRGAIKLACDGGEIEKYAKMIEYIDLSSNQYFENLFVENMIFDV